jgi:type I restriction-modification system DNA methylase subunit
MTKPSLPQLILSESKHYTASLIKSHQRKKDQGEVFTPTPLVLDILNKLPKNVWEEDKTFLDPTCGNGQFLAAVLIVKLYKARKKYGTLTREQVSNILSTIYGADIMADNVAECRKRLIAIAGDSKRNRDILLKNIKRRDGLIFDYEF